MVPRLVKCEIVNGVLRHTLDDGTFRFYSSSSDAVFSYVEEQLGIPKKHGRRKQTLDVLGMDYSHISRARNDDKPVKSIWLLKLHEWSGIPAAELRMAANMEIQTKHPNARRTE